MTTCLGKSCSFGLLCVYFVNVYQFCVCPSFLSGVEGWIWDVIVIIPDHCLSIYYVGAIMKSRPQSTGVQCKREAKLSSMIGSKRMYAGCLIAFIL